MICNSCGKEFQSGNRPDGIPNGIGFVVTGGTINVCADCVIAMGQMDEEHKREFLEKLKDGLKKGE